MKDYRVGQRWKNKKASDIDRTKYFTINDVLALVGFSAPMLERYIKEYKVVKTKHGRHNLVLKTDIKKMATALGLKIEVH